MPSFGDLRRLLGFFGLVGQVRLGVEVHVIERIELDFDRRVVDVHQFSFTLTAKDRCRRSLA
jgi:hypothetical protein